MYERGGCGTESGILWDVNSGIGDTHRELRRICRSDIHIDFLPGPLAQGLRAKPGLLQAQQLATRSKLTPGHCYEWPSTYAFLQIYSLQGQCISNDRERDEVIVAKEFSGSEC